MKAMAAASRRPSMARPSISFAGRRRGERRARRPRGATRPPRRDRAGRRLDDRLGHLHRLGRHRAPAAGARLAARRVGHRRGAHRDGRAQLRAPRRRHAARRRAVRLPERAVRAALGLPLRLDAGARHPDGHDRRRGGRLRHLCRRAVAGAHAVAGALLPRQDHGEPGAGGRGRRGPAAHGAQRPWPRSGTVGAERVHGRQGGNAAGRDRPRPRARRGHGPRDEPRPARVRHGTRPARDGLFLAPAARLDDRHVPGPALWMQGAWASVLALSGRYSDLLDYVIVAELLFYLLTVGGLLVLARRSGERPRGAGYPWLQLAYLVLVAALVVDLLVTKPAYTWGSVAVVASGVPFYALWRRSAAA